MHPPITFADITKGTALEPYALTMLDREDKEGRADAYRRLKNRLKFGTEGALFNLGLIGAGKGVQKIRKPIEEGVPEYVKTPVGKFLLHLYKIWETNSLKMDCDQFISILQTGWMGKSALHSAVLLKAAKDQLFSKCTSKTDWERELDNLEEIKVVKLPFVLHKYRKERLI